MKIKYIDQMTWKDLKELAESLGVTNETKLVYKDMNFSGIDSFVNTGDFSLIDIKEEPLPVLAINSILWEPCS